MRLPVFLPYSSTTILIQWEAQIQESILEDIIQFSKKLTQATMPEIVEHYFLYHSMLIEFDSLKTERDTLIKKLQQLYLEEDTFLPKTKRFLWKIPVCYHREFAKDLPELAKQKQLSEEKLIELHTRAVYTVYGIGFLPGFLYLGGLDVQLHHPRKSTPDTHVPVGSVAIGGSQTGIYPVQSPGGWHIIGRTPISLFSENEPPCFAQAGDKIRFTAIDAEEFSALQSSDVPIKKEPL